MDGRGENQICTGIGFFDHMLTALSRHSFIDMKLKVDGDLETEMVREFFYALSYSARMNLHIKEFSGVNNHHKIEAAFKALARALKEAVSIDESIQGVLSTKGIL